MKIRTHSKISRRSFAGIVTGTGAAVTLSAQQTAATPNGNPAPQRPTGPPPEVQPFSGKIEFARRDVSLKVKPFPMTQVRVTGGIFKEAEDANRGYMSRLAADRLLYNFRQNAGLDVKGAEPLGGWEAPADGKHGTELRGHFTGHFLSASANLYASTGDRIELEMPMRLTVEAMPDDPKLQAFLYGPLVLAGDLGNEGLTEPMIIGPQGPALRRPEGPPGNPNRPMLESIVIQLHAAGTDPADWIKPADKPLTFRTTGQTRDVTLSPLNRMFDRRYSVYWEVS